MCSGNDAITVFQKGKDDVTAELCISVKFQTTLPDKTPSEQLDLDCKSFWHSTRHSSNTTFTFTGIQFLKKAFLSGLSLSLVNSPHKTQASKAEILTNPLEKIELQFYIGN